MTRGGTNPWTAKSCDAGIDLFHLASTPASFSKRKSGTFLLPEDVSQWRRRHLIADQPHQDAKLAGAQYDP